MEPEDKLEDVYFLLSVNDWEDFLAIACPEGSSSSGEALS